MNGERLFNLDGDLTLHSHYAAYGEVAIPPSMSCEADSAAPPTFVSCGYGTFAPDIRSAESRSHSTLLTSFRDGGRRAGGRSA